MSHIPLEPRRDGFTMVRPSRAWVYSLVEGDVSGFTTRFITNTRKPKEINSLLALTMKAGETLKSYLTRYWEVYNDIDACDEDIVVKTFRFGLHEDSKLRKSFTKRPPISMAELMTRLEQHIRD